MALAERVEIEELNPKPRVVALPPPAIQPMISSEPAKNHLVSALEAFLPVFGALAAIMAVRLFLALAIGGAFFLAWTAMSDTTDHGIWVLIAYCAFTILPLVYLDIYGKQRKE